MPAILQPCPICGRDPLIERCEPWPDGLGPAPWYVGCYQGGDEEHCVAVNGDDRADAIRLWDEAVEKQKEMTPCR